MKRIIITCILLFINLLSAVDRERVIIVNNTVKTAEGNMLRGEVRLAMEYQPWRDMCTKVEYYEDLRDNYNLNLVNMYFYHKYMYAPGWPRDPQNPEGSCDDPDICLTTQECIDILDDAVEAASQAEMYLMITYHCSGAHDTTELRQWWDVIAPRYKYRTHVMYQLSNEPAMWSPADYTSAHINIQNYMYQRLRAQAPNTHIVLWTFADMSENAVPYVKQASDVNYSNASVAYHYYKSKENLITVNSNIVTLKNNYPVIMSEYEGGFDSGDPETGLSHMIKQHESWGISWISLKATYPDDIMINIITWSKDPYYSTIYHGIFNDSLADYPYTISDCQDFGYLTNDEYNPAYHHYSSCIGKGTNGYSYNGDHSGEAYSPVITLDNFVNKLNQGNH